ncbi:hypothetical protein ACJ41O_002673 [Fusarium nematophilum]
MESRRRLGKRQMTAILPDSRASPLPWTIDLPFNFGEWTWEAPVAPEKRNREKKRLGLLERLIRWLEGPTQEETSSLVPTPSTETTTLSQADKELANLHTHLARFERLDNKEFLWCVCKRYLSRMVKLVHGRMLSCDDLILALDPFDSHTKERVSAETLDYVRARTWIVIINAIHAARFTPSHDAYGERLWRRCFEEVINMTPQRPTFTLFQRLVTKGVRDTSFSVPKEFYVRLMQRHIMFEVSQPADMLPRLPRRHMNLSREVKFTKMEFTNICEAVVESCALPSNDDARRRKIAFHLILELSCLPLVGRTLFHKLASEAYAPTGWNPQEVFIFTRARLMAKSRNRITLASTYQKALDLEALPWKLLIKAALGDSKHRQQQNLRTIIHACDLFGHLDTLLEEASTMTNGGQILRDIMAASRDPRIAIAAWKMYNVGRRPPAKWNWTIWLPYVKFLAEDPNVKIGFIWEALDLLPFKSIETLPPRRHWQGIGSRMELLEAMGEWFMKRPGLSDRQLLRCIEKLLSYSKVAGERVSKRLITNLANLVVRDLEEGSPGRTERLGYLIEQTKQMLGGEEAERLRLQLNGWRWVIFREELRPKRNREMNLRAELEELEEELKEFYQEQEMAEQLLKADDWQDGDIPLQTLDGPEEIPVPATQPDSIWDACLQQRRMQ